MRSHARMFAVLATVGLLLTIVPNATAFSAFFRDVRRAADINDGPDLCGTGQPSTNFTGSTGAAGDTWITVLDTTPADGTDKLTGSDTSSTGQFIIKRFNNKKGAGLLSHFNEGPADKGLALVIFDNGNTDTLALGTVSAANGTFTTLKSVPLGSQVAECNWYQLSMTATATATDVTVNGTLSKHASGTDPNSATTQFASLSFSGPLPAGVQSSGEVGFVAAATSAVVDSSAADIFSFVLVGGSS